MGHGRFKLIMQRFSAKLVTQGPTDNYRGAKAKSIGITKHNINNILGFMTNFILDIDESFFLKLKRRICQTHL